MYKNDISDCHACAFFGSESILINMRVKPTDISNIEIYMFDLDVLSHLANLSKNE